MITMILPTGLSITDPEINPESRQILASLENQLQDLRGIYLAAGTNGGIALVAVLNPQRVTLGFQRTLNIIPEGRASLNSFYRDQDELRSIPNHLNIGIEADDVKEEDPTPEEEHFTSQ